VPIEESKPVVLIIDDSEDVHRLLRIRLKHESVTLVSSLSGKDGLIQAKAVRPSVILLDLDMPGLDGFGVLRQLKEDGDLANVPVIVLSGMEQAADKVAAFDLGATDYVTKPFEFAELRARLRSTLRLDRLLRLLAERAEVDGLTGLNNRAAFNRRWQAEVDANHRLGRALTLAMMDIDHFKKVNDTYGHPAGDEVLASFASIVRGQIRSTDIACRFGGEEIALIMTQTTPEEAIVVCERVRASLAATVWPRHPSHTVTVSIGYAGSHAASPLVDTTAWLEAADKALYNAKHGGRNRVVAGQLATKPLQIAA